MAGLEDLDLQGAASLAGVGAQVVGGAVGGVIDIFAGAAGKKRGQDALNKANQNLESLKASQPSLSTPTEYYDAVKNAYDQRLLSMRNEDINRSLATTTQAAQQYGSRGLGAVMQAQQQAQGQLRQEAMNQQQLQTQALTNLANAREREIGLRETRSNRDLEYGYDAKALSEAQLAQARQQMSGGIASAVGGLATAGLGMAAAGMFDGKSKPNGKPPKTGAGQEGDYLPPIQYRTNQDFNYGGSYAEKGIKVQKTPGEFNHDTNEMYVVDEDGRDVGIALTGGEYVIAPKDAQKLKQLVGNGKGELHKFVGSLVKRFEKADK